MIVVDTNVVAYALIEGAYTSLASQVRERDAEWRLPTLWRHELLNVLAGYAQHNGAELREALTVWEQALKLFAPCERVVDMELALRLATAHQVSAYDAQFIALAQSLNVMCVTEDRGLLNAFPHLTVSMKQFCSA